MEERTLERSDFSTWKGRARLRRTVNSMPGTKGLPFLVRRRAGQDAGAWFLTNPSPGPFPCIAHPIGEMQGQNRAEQCVTLLEHRHDNDSPGFSLSSLTAQVASTSSQVAHADHTSAGSPDLDGEVRHRHDGREPWRTPTDPEYVCRPPRSQRTQSRPCAVNFSACVRAQI